MTIEETLLQISLKLDMILAKVDPETAQALRKDTRAQGMSGILAKGTNSVI